MRNHLAIGGNPMQSEGMHHQFRPESMQQLGHLVVVLTPAMFILTNASTTLLAGAVNIVRTADLGWENSLWLGHGQAEVVVPVMRVSLQAKQN